MRLLGDVELVVGGVAVPLGGNKQRLALAVLALAVRRVVSFEQFATVLWDDLRRPDHVRRTVQMYVARLRPLLGAPLIQVMPGGYQLAVDPDAVDLYRFRRLVAVSEAEPDVVRRKVLLDEALSLVRGVPLGGVDSDVLEHEERSALEEELLGVQERRIDVGLALGAHDGLVADLRGLANTQPLRESLWARLLVALDRDGRRAEALDTYETVRRRLRQDLGTDPGPPLQRLHRALLDGTDLAWPEADSLIERQPQDAPSSGDPVRPVAATGGFSEIPRQLPAAAPMFTGREAELAVLAGPDHPTNTSAVVITAIDGMAGIGKTTLAVQAAHQLADRYPDGQIFVDLRGYAYDITPVWPGEALEQILRALGVPGERIPPTVDERAALYRTRVAGRRMLLVLDNASTEEQVTPLLPGTPSCLVLITSRRRMVGLDRTRTVSLDVLPLPDAISLFVRTVGEGRLADQSPALIAETVRLCGQLPLAIRLAAARLNSRPSWTVGLLTDRLREHQHRLAELEAGRRGVDAALDLSYQQLSTDQQRAYRLLGLHPGPDIDVCAAAALVNTTVPATREVLDELLDTHLLQERTPDRYAFHDLVRDHARQAAQTDTVPDKRAALTRLFDHYRHTATSAVDIAYPYGRERRPRVPVTTTPTQLFPDPARATGWLDDEMPNLLAAAAYAAGHGWRQHTTNLSSILHPHLRTRGRYADAEALHEHAVETAREVGDRSSELDALACLGHVLLIQGRLEQAAQHYRTALDVARSACDEVGALDARNGLAQVYLRLGQFGLVLDECRQALDTARSLDYHNGEVDALHGLGRAHLSLGEYGLAFDEYQQLLEIARGIGHRDCELNALYGLGRIHLFRGEYGLAVAGYQRLLDTGRRIGHRGAELNALHGLGQIHLLLAEYGPAADDFQRSLDIARAIGNLHNESIARCSLGEVHLEQGRYRQAGDSFQRSLDLALRVGSRNLHYEALQGLGRVSQVTGHPADAWRLHQQALALATELGNPADQARAHNGLAHASHALHQPQQAGRHWQQALRILAELGADRTEEPHVDVSAIRAHLADLNQLSNTTLAGR